MGSLPYMWLADEITRRTGPMSAIGTSLTYRRVGAPMGPPYKAASTMGSGSQPHIQPPTLP